MLATAVLAAPWGPVNVAVADVPVAGSPGPRPSVVAVEILTPPEAFARGLERRLGRLGEPGDASPALRQLLADATGQLEEYLAGRRRAFELPSALLGANDWDRRVLEGVRTIPWGTVTSYGRLARRIDRPGAARAVGGAVGRNTLGLLVPCHRVIAGDGSLGGYGGDWWGTRDELLAVKRSLLELEGVRIPARTFFD